MVGTAPGSRLRWQPIGSLTSPTSKTDPRKSPGRYFSYIDISSIDTETKTVKDPTRLVGLDAPSRARQVVESGDVVVSTVRPNLNAVAQITDQHRNHIASTGFCVLRPDPTLLNSRYLFHWVRSSEFIGEMVKLASGASYPAVTDRIVKQSKMPVPPIEEQLRIAAVLDAAEALRVRRREALAKLDTLTQAIFIDMFGDPVANSKGWRDDRVLSDVADVRSGITKGRKTGDSSLQEVPFLAVVNVQDGLIVLDPLKTIYATEAEIEKYLLASGDILLTEGGDPDKLGRGAVWRGQVDPCIHQNHVFRVRIVEDSMTPEFLSRLLGSPRGKRYFLRMAKQTTGIASINMTQLKAFPMFEPPLELQQVFLERLDRMTVTESRARRSADELDVLLASLQQRAYRGEM